MNANDIATIQRKLERLNRQKQAMNEEMDTYTRDLEWKVAVEMADSRYKSRYIVPLSENYRRGCEWWVEIGDSLIEYFRKNPYIEAWIRRLYFKKYGSSQSSQPSTYIDV